jgi:hypothetical protein
LAADRLIDRMQEDAKKDKEFSRVVGHVLQVLIQLPQSWQAWAGENSGPRQPAVVGSTSGAEQAPPAEQS